MFFRPRKCIRHTQLRSFSQTHDKIPSNLKEAVDLSYTAYLPEDGNAMKQALIILDGVRWTIVSMQMSLKTWIFFYLFKVHCNMPERLIYALDLRNHGSSPHALPMTYKSMASDGLHAVSSRYNPTSNG